MITTISRFILFILFIVSINSDAVENYCYKLSVCAMFQNEAPYLKEWIEFHKLVGVEHFYLYNNLSMDGFRRVLAPYIKAKEVTLIDWPYKSETGCWFNIQIDCYTDAANKSAGQTKWLACLDLDEFLMPVANDSLVKTLEQYESFGGVCVNWQMYGTSFIEEIPEDKLLIEMLLFKAETNYALNGRFKSIIRPDRVRKCISPHYFAYKKPYHHVASAKKQVTSLFFGPFIDTLRINHYWCRDEKYFKEHKLNKRQRWGDSKEFILERYRQLNFVKDDCILRFVPALKKKMEIV